MRKSVILLLTVTLPVAAQWINYRDPQTPRKNGKPALSAPLPRMNGKTGQWPERRSRKRGRAAVKTCYR
jgi:hypothetical protein